METIEKAHRDMTESPVPQLLFKLAAPSILAALLPPLVSTFELFLASRIFSEACGALGIAFPIHAAIQTIGFVFGTGSGSLLANALGKKDTEKAHQLAFGALFFALLFSGALAFFGLLFQNPLLRFLGANAELLPIARPYAICLLASAPVMCACFVLSNLLRAEGKTFFAMLGLGLGNLISVASSALFVLRLGFGLLGIGLSIALGYAFALLFLLFPYFRGRCLASIFPVFSDKMFKEAKSAAINGLPSLFRQGLTVIAVILFNWAAGKFGNPAITAVSITSRTFLLLYAIPLGIGQGMIPAVGFNNGNGDPARAKRIYLWCVAAATALTCFFALPIVPDPKTVLQWFTKDPSVLSFGVPLLRSLCLVLPLHGLIAVTNLLLQVIKRPIAASVLAAARQGFFFLPLIFFLPERFGFSGVWLTQPIADGFTFLLSLFFAIRFLKYEKRSG